MLNFVRNKLIDWKVVEPTAIDVMDKYIRNHLTKKQLTLLNEYVIITSNDTDFIIKIDNQFCFAKKCKINYGYPNGTIPSCYDFGNNIQKYNIIINDIIKVLIEEKYNEDQKKLEDQIKFENSKICNRKLWKSIK